MNTGTASRPSRLLTAASPAAVCGLMLASQRCSAAATRHKAHRLVALLLQPLTGVTWYRAAVLQSCRIVGACYLAFVHMHSDSAAHTMDTCMTPSVLYIHKLPSFPWQPNPKDPSNSTCGYPSYTRNQPPERRQNTRYPRLANAAAIWFRSYLTYFPFPLSMSWYFSQNRRYSGSISAVISFANTDLTSFSML
jgi:hypothetical protein